MIRVVLPYHLRTLAGAESEVQLEVERPVTLRSVLDALEAQYPMLRGTIRDHATLRRRPFLRFYACKEDWSHEPPETNLPEEVATGVEPLLIVGAMAGGWKSDTLAAQNGRYPAAFFIREKAKGRLAKDVREEQMADFCITAIQGAMLLGKVKRNSQPVETTVRETLAHLRRYAITLQASPESPGNAGEVA
jgi:molybdopterin synthase sulfur carrier subunit